jgi:hypothetical protein
VGRFVPFSELDRWLDHLHEESSIPTFKDEDKYAESLFAMFDTPDQHAADLMEKQSRLFDGLKVFSRACQHRTQNDNLTRFVFSETAAGATLVMLADYGSTSKPFENSEGERLMRNYGGSGGEAQQFAS